MPPFLPTPILRLQLNPFASPFASPRPRGAPTEPPTEPAYTSPYRAKKRWPPNMDLLTPKQQFRFERRYVRRSKLKWARPVWTKWVKIVQFGSVGVISIYGVLFMEWEQPGVDEHIEPFAPIRRWFFGKVDSIFGKEAVLRRNPQAKPTEKS